MNSLPRHSAHACARHVGQTQRRARAFTLIEAIATIVVLGVIGSLVSSIILRSINDYTTIATSAQAQADLSSAMDRLDRELREIALKSGGGVRPDITTAGVNSITYATSKVFALSGTTLNYTDSSGTTPLLDNVSTFTIQAFDADNTSLGATVSGAACDNIRRLAITVAITRNNVTETLRTKVFLRNTLSGAGS